MPWKALPFESPLKDSLSEEFAVRGIPTFIILGADGSIKDKDGRTTVSQAQGDTSKALAKWA